MPENHLSQNLKYLFQKRSIDIINLATTLGESPEAIAKLKSGDLKNPSLNITIKLAGHFDLSLDSLVFEHLSNEK